MSGGHPRVELALPIRLVKLHVPGEDSLEDRYNSLNDGLFTERKERLYSTGRNDPDVRMAMLIDCDVSNNELASVGKSSKERNRKVFKLEFNKEFKNSLLLIRCKMVWTNYE
mgnify:CR=1 FL=1